jgi:hypothetical protein
VKIFFLKDSFRSCHFSSLKKSSTHYEVFHRSIDIDPEYDLPWPGFENVTTDQENSENRCAAPAHTPVPTQVTFPAVLAGAVILTRKW